MAVCVTGQQQQTQLQPDFNVSSSSRAACSECQQQPSPASPSHHPRQVCEPRPPPAKTVRMKASTVPHDRLQHLAKLACNQEVSVVEKWEQAGVVTAEDHGRRGSHHGEERWVLGALLRRHCHCSLRTLKLNGTISSLSYGGGFPCPTVTSGQLNTPRNSEGDQRRLRWRRGKWRNGKSHMTNHGGRIQLGWGGCASPTTVKCLLVLLYSISKLIPNILALHILWHNINITAVFDVFTWVTMCTFLFSGMFCCKCTDCSWN